MYIENKYFTPKTAFYKALTTDYLDINRELNKHLLGMSVICVTPKPNSKWICRVENEIPS